MLTTYLMMLDTDEERERFLLIYQTYRDLVHAVAFTLLKRETQAEDVAQQVWMDVIERFPRISAIAPENRRGYLAVMARNQALRLLAKEWREVPVGDPRDACDVLHDSSERDGAYLRDMIRALPEHYRQVLEMRLVEELSTAETAQALGVPVSTVTTRLQRGKEMLKTQLKKEGYIT